MPTVKVAGNLDAPQVDVLVDLGHPLLNRIFDAFVKVGGVGATHAVAQDTYKYVSEGAITKKSLEATGKRVGRDAVQWGLVAGVYSGFTYGLQESRKTSDWKNAVLGGLLTGATLSLTESNPSADRIARGALTGGAIAAAGDVLRHFS